MTFAEIATVIGLSQGFLGIGMSLWFGLFQIAEARISATQMTGQMASGEAATLNRLGTIDATLARIEGRLS
jgi:hypothetical protein